MGKPSQPRKIVIIQARYIDQTALEDFLTSVFGFGGARVTWTRGVYQCTLPRGLKKDEVELLKDRVQMEHYEEQ
ncbi:hypothetical protein EDB80DRAFT_881618 [Ilyonectria destructans]|nr:hypothetical protein EDB80DRAFT_881618 [Ilyonectria destructans]